MQYAAVLATSGYIFPVIKISDTQLEELKTGQLLTIKKMESFFPLRIVKMLLKMNYTLQNISFKENTDQNSHNLFIHMNITSLMI